MTEENRLDLEVGRNYQYFVFEPSTGCELVIDEAEYLGLVVMPCINMNFHVFSFIDSKSSLIKKTGEKHYILKTEGSIKLDVQSNAVVADIRSGHSTYLDKFLIEYCLPPEEKKSLIKLLNSSGEKI